MLSQQRLFILRIGENMQTKSTSLLPEFLLLVLLATLWGSAYSFIKIGIETIPPITLIAARTLIAGMILWAIIFWRRLPIPKSPAVWRRFFIQAALNSVVPFTLIAWAELTTDAALATILNSTTPIFAFLITAIITRHEAVTRYQLFGVAAGLLGVCLIVGVDALSGLGHQTLPQLAILFASVCYAIAAIYGKNFKGLDPLFPAAGSMICGAILLIPASLILDRPWTLSPSSASLMALLGLSVFSTALAFSIYFRLIQTLGSVRTTAQAFLRVPMGVAFGVFLLGEHLSSTALIGLVLIMAAVGAMQLRPRSR